MNALQIYHDAEWALEHNKITLGEFDERIKPLADVEAVVRCKDCKFWKKTIYDTPNWMPCMSVQTDGNWFCPYGKRKEGDGDENQR